MNIFLADSVDLTSDLVGEGWKLAGLFGFQGVKYINLLWRDFFPSHDGLRGDPSQPTLVPWYTQRQS